MKDILQAFAAAQEWQFDYGRADFHNLYNEKEETGQTYLFLDPVEISKNRNDNQQVESISYSGSFMLLYSSNIDELSYNERYENYIKPLINSQADLIEQHLICEHESSLDEWRIIEVINILDYNLDGIIITFKVTINE